MPLDTKSHLDPYIVVSGAEVACDMFVSGVEEYSLCALLDQRRGAFAVLPGLVQCVNVGGREEDGRNRKV